MKHPRFRHTYMFIGGVLVLILYVLTDPNANIIQDLPFGASTLVLISTLLKGVWYVAFLHMSRRALLDYLDLTTLFKKAEESPEGAGYAIIGVGTIMVACAIAIAAAVLSS